MGVVAINFVEFGSLLFEVTKNFRNFSEEEICLGKCTKVALQGSKDPGSQCAMPMMSHQGTLQCGLVNGLQKALWIEQESRNNLTHMCVTLILRASRQISAVNTSI